jgi:Transposase, Mutator family
MKEQPMSDEKPMGQVIQIDEARIRDHLGEMARGTVEETLNAMLDAEADRLCGAGRYERNKARQDTRAGSYDRTLQTSADEVNLKVPKLRRQTFETAIIERYRSRVQEQSTGGTRPDASENSQISPSTIVRAARAAGSHPHLASVLQQGRKSANIALVWESSGESRLRYNQKCMWAALMRIPP